MIFHWLILLFYFFLFNYLIYKVSAFQLRHFKPVVTIALFNLKLLTGILIWAIYTFYYKDLQNNDVHKFYNDALVLQQASAENPSAFVKLLVGQHDESTAVYASQMKNWERNFDEAPVNENRTIIKLNALLMFFSRKVYFVHVLFMCLISLLGWVWIFNGIFDFAKLKPFPLSLLVLILPSVLFWTSGVMKEPLLVFGLGLFIKGLLNLNLKKGTAIIWLLGGIIVLLSIKFYVLVCILPASVAFLIPIGENKLLPLLSKYFILYGLVCVAAFSVQYILPSFNPVQMLVNKEVHSVKEAIYFNAGSRIEIPELNASTVSILKAVPVGIWNTVGRPYLWETKNPMMLAGAAENILVLLMIFFGVLNARGSFSTLNLVLFLLAFSFTYFAVIGMCTPVLGNLVRYKAPVMPFFIMAFMLASYKSFKSGIAGRTNEKILVFLLAE